MARERERVVDSSCSLTKHGLETMELLIGLLLTTLVVEVIAWIGSDRLASLVRTPSPPLRLPSHLT